MNGADTAPRDSSRGAAACFTGVAPGPASRGAGALARAARSWRAIAALTLAAALTVFAAPDGAQERAMAKMVIFSAVSGKVLHEGKPVAGATVEREFNWGWKNETGRDSTTTGPDGEFTLPKIERSSILGSLLPHEPVVAQDLIIRHAGKAYKAWMFNKHDYRDNGESAGKPLRLVCRLEAEPVRHDGGYFGICELE